MSLYWQCMIHHKSMIKEKLLAFHLEFRLVWYLSNNPTWGTARSQYAAIMSLELLSRQYTHLAM